MKIEKINKNSLIFYLLLFLSAAFFFLSSFFTKEAINPVKNYPSPYNSINIVIEGNKLKEGEILIEKNKKIFTPELKENTFNKALSGKINSLNILIEQNKSKEVESVVIFNDSKINHFSGLSSFKKGKINYKGKNYNLYEAPNSIKQNPKSGAYNFNSYLSFFSGIFLSFFSFSCPILILPYLMLFISIFYYIKNEDKIIRPYGYLIFAAIFAIGILLRLNGLFDYLPHLDEYFSIYFSNPSIPFSYVFEDAGNPPVFYILFRLYLKIFNISLISIKMFPFLISIFGLLILWLFLKKEFDIKTANTGLFLSSVSLPLIYYSNEIRSYILQIAIVPLVIYLLFKILDTNKTKYYVLYAVCTAVISNIHYYMILFLVSNFIYGAAYFLIQKKYIEILKFFNANLFGILFFIPYFSLTSNEFALNNSGFNDWIQKPDFGGIKTILLYITGGFFSFILSFVFFFKSLKRNDKRGKIIVYSFFTILSILFFSILISYLIRPITVIRYFSFLYPVFIIFLTLVFTDSNKNKFFIFLFIPWFLFVQNSDYDSGFRKKGIIDYPLSASFEYIKKADKNEHIYVVTNQAKENLSFGHEKLLSDKIQYVSQMALSFEDVVNEILKKDKNAVIFTTLIDENKIRANKTRFYNPAADSVLWKIKIL